MGRKASARGTGEWEAIMNGSRAFRLLDKPKNSMRIASRNKRHEDENVKERRTQADRDQRRESQEEEGETGSENDRPRPTLTKEPFSEMFFG